MQFKKDSNPLRTLRIGRSVFDELKEHPICKCNYDPGKDIKDPRDPDFRVWINPQCNFSFKSGWCSESDLRDWMAGTGFIVKGNTQEEKKKYWDYAVFESGDTEYSRWLIKYTWKWFDEFTSDFNPHKGGVGLVSMIEDPIKIPNIRTRDYKLNIQRQERIIIDMFAPFISEIVSDLEYSEWSMVRRRYQENFYGMKRALYSLGVGYLGACNTPTEISNLSWVTDIVFAKALYQHLQNTGVPLPDFQWLISREESLYTTV
jgi:hypothetical protein